MRPTFSLWVCACILVFSPACSGDPGKNSTEQNREKPAVSDSAKEVNSEPDTIRHSFDNYEIVVVPHKGEVGEAIIVRDKKRNRSFTVDDGDTYYVDVVDSFLIIDAGTSASRGLNVYNLNSKKNVFEGSYYGKLDLKEKRLFFKTAVDIKEESLKPKCPAEKNTEYNGFLEEQVLDLTNLQLTKTGKYECAYFE
jgi:hypothetical protein